MEPLISIIVPVYKVEPYLRKCVDSILNQTYKNLEIILVDDGSPDNCGAICDAYAAQDHRVKVIHKENGGVSCARTAGITAASGDYISFVDSDDWLDCNVYSKCINALPFDMAIFGVTYVYENSNCIQVIPACDQTHNILWGHDDHLILDLFASSLFGYMWNKIYSRHILHEIVFPDIPIREDLIINLNALKRTEKLVLIDCNGYCYFQRNDSQLHSNYWGTIPDISMIAHKLIVKDNKLSKTTNQAISSILIRNHLIDALYQYVFTNCALSDHDRVRSIRQIFSDRTIVSTLKFPQSGGSLAVLLYFCAKFRCSRLFFSIMKRKWYV